MSLPVLAVAALLLGSAAVLTVVATNPTLAALEPSAAAGPASEAGGAGGRLELRISNEADPARVHLTVRAGERVLFDQDVTLPAKDTWSKSFAVPAGAVATLLDSLHGHVHQEGDLRACPEPEAVSAMLVRVEAGGLAGSRFKGDGVLCTDGSAAAYGPEASEEGADEAEDGFAMAGRFTLGAGLAGPHPMCGFQRCGYNYASGSVAFEVGRPMQLDVRASWSPSTPASERLAILLSRSLGDGSGEGVGGGEGGREVAFTVDLVEPGMYRLSGWATGEPVGLVVAQEVNVEVLETPLA